jgi:hypothetical protein
MDSPESLIACIMAEDRLLRQLLAGCPDQHRERRCAGQVLSFKETLGHLAFWDTLAVSSFLQKLDTSTDRPVPLQEIEQKSREDLKRLSGISFDEVFRLYDEATDGVANFLRGHWHELSPKQRLDFRVPLRHRRHHRLLLKKALTEMKGDDKPRRRAAQA